MKRITLLLFFLSSMFSFSQSPIDKINGYMQEKRTKLKLTQNDISDLLVVNEFSSETTGINNYHVKQKVNGIEVYNSNSNFLIKNGVVFAGGEDFLQNIQLMVNTSLPVVSIENALLSVMNSIGNNTLSEVRIIENTGNSFKLTNGILQNDLINAQLIYFLTDDNKLTLAWSYEFYSQDTKHLWDLKIDAVTGKIIYKKDMVISCNFSSGHSNHSHNNVAFTKSLFKEDNASSFVTPGTTNYRVIPWNYESPFHSPRVLITNPETANASPNGWHNANFAIGSTTPSNVYNYTRGNNVWAVDDVDANNSGGTNPIGTGAYPSLTFDFPYGGDGTQPSTYLNASITNLFYMNNIMHDLWYQYGFNELNGNFQRQNYGRGGSANDAVNADAQDGASIDPQNLNNANFSTPSIGAPRMQMYLWRSKKPSDMQVIGGQHYNVFENNFDPGYVGLPIAPSVLTAPLVLYEDAVTDTSDACTAATPANAILLNGKIAVIRRGDCTFAIKVKNAQTAGAIGVLIVNNVASPLNITMAGSDATINIPAVSINQADGEALIAAMSSGVVTVSLSSPELYINGDGDFDNGIIAHEYGHGISTRLSGGLNSSEQQGEGWSDWFWLMMQIKPGDTRNDARGIGTYAENDLISGPGIRQYRYSTDMSVNPHTFGVTNSMWYTDTDGFEQVNVHAVGSVWAVMLWDLAWNYIDKYGYDSNIYNGTGGNNKVMRLVLDAIKIDGSNPSFVSARDAIIAADQATTGGVDYCMIWETFARRGLGANASSGGNSGVFGIKDQTEDFSTPAPGPNCTLSVDYFENQELVKIYPNPSNGLINVNISNYSGKLDIEVFDLNGRNVFTSRYSDFNNLETLSLNNIQSGIYLLKLKGEDFTITRKIIID